MELRVWGGKTKFTGKTAGEERATQRENPRDLNSVPRDYSVAY